VSVTGEQARTVPSPWRSRVAVRVEGRGVTAYAALQVAQAAVRDMITRWSAFSGKWQGLRLLNAHCSHSRPSHEG
jgi:hypothetical protein